MEEMSSFPWGPRLQAFKDTKNFVGYELYRVVVLCHVFFCKQSLFHTYVFVLLVTNYLSPHRRYNIGYPAEIIICIFLDSLGAI